MNRFHIIGIFSIILQLVCLGLQIYYNETFFLLLNIIFMIIGLFCLNVRDSKHSSNPEDNNA